MKKIFKGSVVTSNPSHDVFMDGFLAIDKDQIVAVGNWKDRPKKGFTVSDEGPQLIIPGLFNLHTHLALSFLRGIAEDIPLQEWLEDYIFPTEKKFVSPSFVREGTALGLAESIKNGVTTMADMYFHMEESAKVFDQSGARGIIGQNIWDLPGPDYPDPAQTLVNLKKLVQKYKNHSRIQIAAAPHAPYTCSEKLLSEVSAFSEENKILLMIHLAESKKEVEDLKAKGVSPTELLERVGILGRKEPTLLAHSIWLDENDFLRLKKYPATTLVPNPLCNSKLGSGFFKVESALKHGVRFAVGTDSAASNNSLDILSELHHFSKAHHLLTDDLLSLKGKDLLDAATRHAATAVGWGDKLGSLETGKQADFAVIPLNKPHLVPLFDPYAHLIHTIRGSDVDSVYVAGKALMKKRKLLTLNESKIVSSATAMGQKIRREIFKR